MSGQMIREDAEVTCSALDDGYLMAAASEKALTSGQAEVLISVPLATDD